MTPWAVAIHTVYWSHMRVLRVSRRLHCETDRTGTRAATGHTAAWVVFSVSQHPEVEAKIVEELRQHDLLATAEQPNPRAIQWDDIPKLTYLNAVIKVSFPAR